MAEARALASISCWSRTRQEGISPACHSRILIIHEEHRRPLTRHRRTQIESSARGRPHPANLLGSGFAGQLELRGAVAGQESGRHGGGRRWSTRRVGVARAGLPVVSGIPVLGPVLNAFLNPVVLFILYAAGASRFWSGFERTSYSTSVPTKVSLTALWPALFIASAAFRSNFKKAVK